MSGGGGRKAASPGGEDAEVEALIRAAQDAVLLKLQANSHLVSSTSASASAPAAPLDDAKGAPDPLDDDLARRFDALKSRAVAAPKPKAAGAGAAAPGGMDELEARFAALKGAAGPEKEARVRLEDLGGESSEDEADEVDKVMRWAMDAARLDVATAGADGGKAKRADEEEGAGGKAKGDDDDDDEEDEDEKSSVSSEEDDEDERLQLEMARKRKETAKSKSKSKWFFL